jgi:anti-anti-sigma factor
VGQVFAPLRTRRQIGAVVIVGGVYFAAAKLGLKLAFIHPSATPVWPPTGIAIASLLLIGSRAWPGIFAGAFLANLTTAGTVWTSLGIATGNTLEGLVGMYLVNTYANGRNAFDRPQDIFKFAALGAIASTTVSPTIGVTSLALGGFASWSDYRPIWLTWWLGDAAGALIVTPLLVHWSKRSGARWDGRPVVERVLFLFTLLSVSWVVFSGAFAFPYLTVPFLIWAAFRFDPRETITVIVLITALAVWGTVRGLGPFVGATPNESLLLLQVFMGIMVMVTLPLSSVVADNARRMTAEHLARRAAERAVERTAQLQAVTSALSGAVTRAQVVSVIVGQGILTLGARAGFVSALTAQGDALCLIGHVGYPEEFASSLGRVPLAVSRPITDVVRTGEPLFFESEASMRSRYPDVRTFHQDVARAIIPLSTARRHLGVLALSFSTPRVFSQDDRSFILTLAHQCAQALERARLYEHEHYVAETLQQAFLPAALPDVPGIEIDAVYVPGASESDVGGDWYDVFRLPGGQIALSVGDVVGTGMRAAVVMGQVRQSIRATALEGEPPSVVLERASKVLRLTYERDGMATAIFGILDPVASTFVYTTAGHPPPVLATLDGRSEFLASGGVPLGIREAKLSPVRTASLPAGALLALYTDGLIESGRNLAKGEEDLLVAMRDELNGRSSRPARALLERVVGPRDPGDDIAIVTVSVAHDPVGALALTLPAEPASSRQARLAIRQLARALHLDNDATFALEVVVGEAANNAIEHAYGAGAGTFDLRAERDADTLKIEVADRGRWRPAREDDRGHGLTIMEGLMDAVEVDRQPSGTTVRLAVSLASAHVPPAPVADVSSPDEPAHEAEPGLGEVRSRAVAPGPSPRFQDGRFEVRHLDGVPVIDVSGDVDITNARDLEDTLERAARSDKRAVVVSLAGAAFLDSKAIQTLFRFGQRLANNRQRLLLVVARDWPPGRVIDITGLAEAFPVFESAADALAALGMGGSATPEVP